MGLRYIVLAEDDYEGMWCPDGGGQDEDPLPTFSTREEADKWADELELKKRGPSNYRTILAIEVPDREIHDIRRAYEHLDGSRCATPSFCAQLYHRHRCDG